MNAANRRPYAALLGAVTAALQGDGEMLVAALRTGHASALEERHRCGAFLAESARTLGVLDRLDVPMQTSLRRARLHGIVSAERMGRRIEGVITALREGGVPFALLKGAARVYAREPGATTHPSGDIDVLIPRDGADAAAAALERAGYRRLCSPREARRYRRRHHHDAPLYPADGAFPVEVHRAISVPGAASTPGDWDALRAHMAEHAGSSGLVLALDEFAAALHLALHAVEATRLRDAVLLALRLRLLSDADRMRLRAVANEERTDPVRLRAAFAFAAALAGIGWDAGADVRAYIRWTMRREDLPEWMRDHSWLSEVRHGWEDQPLAQARRLVVGPLPRLDRPLDRYFVPLRSPVRAAVGIAVERYARRMEPPAVRGLAVAD